MLPSVCRSRAECCRSVCGVRLSPCRASRRVSSGLGSELWKNGGFERISWNVCCGW